MLLKHVYMDWKFWRTLALDMSFRLEYFFISVAISTQVASASLKLLVLPYRYDKIWVVEVISICIRFWYNNLLNVNLHSLASLSSPLSINFLHSRHTSWTYIWFVILCIVSLAKMPVISNSAVSSVDGKAVEQSNEVH